MREWLGRITTVHTQGTSESSGSDSSDTSDVLPVLLPAERFFRVNRGAMGIVRLVVDNLRLSSEAGIGRDGTGGTSASASARKLLIDEDLREEASPSRLLDHSTRMSTGHFSLPMNCIACVNQSSPSSTLLHFLHIHVCATARPCGGTIREKRVGVVPNTGGRT